MYLYAFFSRIRWLRFGAKPPRLWVMWTHLSRATSPMSSLTSETWQNRAKNCRVPQTGPKRRKRQFPKQKVAISKQTPASHVKTRMSENFKQLYLSGAMFSRILLYGCFFQFAVFRPGIYRRCSGKWRRCCRNCHRSHGLVGNHRGNETESRRESPEPPRPWRRRRRLWRSLCPRSRHSAHAQRPQTPVQPRCSRYITIS